jgi:hypothetical protein
MLCTNVRDEPSLPEWVQHHLNLGFSPIVILDHESREPVTTQLFPRFARDAVVVRSVTGGGNQKLRWMQQAVTWARALHAQWMLYLDADEFVVLPMEDSMSSWLARVEHHAGGRVDAVSLNWVMFGTSGQVSQPSGLVMDSFVRCDAQLNPHVKTCVRPDAVVSVPNPHWFGLRSGARRVAADGASLGAGPFYAGAGSWRNASAYVAHYYLQSEEEHWRRKARVLDDGTRGKEQLVQDVHHTHNDDLNEDVSRRYGEAVRHGWAVRDGTPSPSG